MQNNSLVGLVQHALGHMPAATTCCDAAQACAVAWLAPVVQWRCDCVSLLQGTWQSPVPTVIQEDPFLQALADHADERQGRLFGQRDANVPCALHRIAALRLASVWDTRSGPVPRKLCYER